MESFGFSNSSYSTSGRTLEDVSNASSDASQLPLFGWYRRTVPQMPIFGSPGPLFFIIHWSALISLLLSGVMNVGLLLYIFVFSKRRNPDIGESSSSGPFWKKSPSLAQISFGRETSSTAPICSLRESSSAGQISMKESPPQYNQQVTFSLGYLPSNTTNMSLMEESTVSSQRIPEAKRPPTLAQISIMKKSTSGAHLCAMRSSSQHRARSSFWNRTTGERLVTYLAISDMAYSIVHIMDHGYYALMERNPPDLFCSIIGAFFVIFTLSQWFIVLFTAISAFSLVVIGKQINHGRYDWKLLVVVFGVPTVNSIFLFFLGLNGQSGAWCIIDLRTAEGRGYSQVFVISQLVMCGLMGVAYCTMWITMKRTAKLVDARSKDRYRNSAHVMFIFVVIFFIQWWPFAMFNIWNLFTTPPSYFPVLTGILVNLGGFYDCVAYTIIRRRLFATKHKIIVRRSIEVPDALPPTPPSSTEECYM